MKVINLLIWFIVPLAISTISCTSDSDCKSLNSCSDGNCIHKDLFPITGSEWGGIISISVLGIFATAGGAGGSVACNSIILLLFYFDVHNLVFGGTLTTVILKFGARHPIIDRPLIYYDVLFQLVAPSLLGVTIGVLISPMFPSWVLLTLLTVISGFLVYTFMKKSVQLYKKESADKRVKSENLAKEENNIPDNRKSIGKDQEENKPQENCEEKDQFVNVHPELAKKVMAIQNAEQRRAHYLIILFILMLMGLSIMTSAFLGSSASKSVVKIDLCGGGYFGILFAYIFIMLGLSVATSFYLHRKHRICEEGKYIFDDADLKWNTKRCLQILLTGLIGGFLVGLLALGAGYTIGPALLLLHVRPEVSTVTSSFMLFILATTALVQYIIFGMIDPAYGVMFVIIGIIGALVGVLGLRKVVVNLGRPSLLIMAAGLTLIVAFFIFPSLGIYNSVQESDSGTFQLGFTSVC